MCRNVPVFISQRVRNREILWVWKRKVIRQSTILSHNRNKPMDIAPLALFCLWSPVSRGSRFSPWSFRCKHGNNPTPRYVTFLKDCCDVFGSVREHDSSLARDSRIHSLFLGMYRYGAWTQTGSHDSPHACATPDAPGVATRDHHLGGARPTGPDYSPGRRWHADHGHCRHRWHQPPLYL